MQRCDTDLDIQPGGIRNVLPSNHYGSELWYKLKCREAMLVQTNIGKAYNDYGLELSGSKRNTQKLHLLMH